MATANIYLNSVAGSNTSPYDTWAKGATTAAAAAAVAVAGDRVWAASDHNEAPGAAWTVAWAGTLAAPITITSVNRAGSVPPVAADITPGAIVSCGAGTFSGSWTGYSYTEGLSLKSGNSGTCQVIVGTGVAHEITLKNCLLAIPSTGASSSIQLGTNGAVAELLKMINTQVSFGAVGQRIQLYAERLIWENTPSAIQGTTPTTCLFGTFGGNAIAKISGVDLSALGATPVVLGGQSNNEQFHFEDCKLGASYVLSGAQTSVGVIVAASRCGNSAVNCITEKHTPLGALTTELSIIRTGGANDGTTGYSWKVIPSAINLPYRPFEAPPIYAWNTDITGNLTVSVNGVWSGGAVPNNDDCWIEVEYLGAAGNPMGSFATSGKATWLTAGSPNAADAVSTWGGSTTKFTMAVTFTAPAQVGLIKVTPKFGGITGTFYIDPVAVLS